MPLHEKRIRESGEEEFGEFVRLPGARFVGPKFVDDYRKLVARQAAYDGVIRQRRCQALGYGLQGRVTGEVTEGVIDLLERIDIDVEEAQRSVSPRALAIDRCSRC